MACGDVGGSTRKVPNDSNYFLALFILSCVTEAVLALRGSCHGGGVGSTWLVSRRRCWLYVAGVTETVLALRELFRSCPGNFFVVLFV